VLAGTIVYTARAAAPTGWLFLDGSTVVNGQTLYPALWAVIPAGWQSGANIVLPNARGRFFIGLDPGTAAYDAVSETGGASTVALSAGHLPPHSHSGTTGNQNANHNHNPGSGTVFQNQIPFGGSLGLTAGGNGFPSSGTTGIENQTHGHAFTTDNGPGSSTAFSILPPFMAFNTMIRAY
jgi:microcystin-dependent protein